jgi:hypothetical protein
MMERLFRNKKGVELTLNTVIIAILVVLVLVVLIGFLLGGTGKAKDQINELFDTSTTASSLSIAIEQCKIYCDQIEETGMDETTIKKNKANLPFCSHGFKIDANGDGENSTGETSVKCSEAPLFVSCPHVTC